MVMTDWPQGQFKHFAKISNGHNSATRQPLPSCLVPRLGFHGWLIERLHLQLDRIQDGGRWPSWKTKWPNLWNALSDSLYVCTQTILCPRTQICDDGDSKLISQGGSLADLRYKGKEWKGSSWEVVEKITRRKEYALHWSRSKVFLVLYISVQQNRLQNMSFAQQNNTVMHIFRSLDRDP